MYIARNGERRKAQEPKRVSHDGTCGAILIEMSDRSWIRSGIIQELKKLIALEVEMEFLDRDIFKRGQIYKPNRGSSNDSWPLEP